MLSCPNPTLNPPKRVISRPASPLLLLHTYCWSHLFWMSWDISKSLWPSKSTQGYIITKWPLSTQASIRNNLETSSVVRATSCQAISTFLLCQSTSVRSTAKVTAPTILIQLLHSFKQSNYFSCGEIWLMLWQLSLTPPSKSVTETETLYFPQ